MGDSSIQLVPDNKRWGALALVITAQFMVILDVAIVNVALPEIKDALGFSQQSLQWVITAYAIFFGGILLLGGRLADLLGRRLVFLTGLAVFSLSSLLAGLAWSEQTLIAFRALQGLGGALLAPAALAILMTTFPEGRERNMALGIWGAASASGAAAGALIGGSLTTYLSWSWIFFINVPVGLAVIVLTPWVLREGRVDSAGRRHFDFSGAAAVTAGLMLLVYAMTRGTEDGWGSASTIALIGSSAALILGFVVIELRSRMPLLPLGIFRLRTLTAANVTGLFIASIAFSWWFLQTLYFQEVLGYSAMQTGLAFLPMALIILVFSNVAQKLVTRFGPGPVLGGGLLLTSAALAFLSRAPADGHYVQNVLPGLVVGGVGMAHAFVPMTIAGLMGVGRGDAGVASGLINTSRQVGAAVGLAGVSSVVTSSASAYADGREGVTASSGMALTHGFQSGFYVLTALAVLGAVIAALFIRPPRRAEAEPVTEEVLALEEAA